MIVPPLFVNFYTVAVALLVYMSLAYIVALIKRRNDIADVAWGLGFMLAGFASLFLHQPPSPRGLLVTTLVAIWGFRLSTHILQRNKNKPEDYRYTHLRKNNNAWFYIYTYFQVFFLQGILLFIIATPVILINLSPSTPTDMLDILGLIIWMIGFLFEMISDYQLSVFIRKPHNKGKVMSQGLWKYSRHPNYFGEVTQWWGIFLFALSVPYGWLTIIGPITITYLILKVSGIPLLEKRYEGHEEFSRYKATTSPFFPLPPKKHPHHS